MWFHLETRPPRWLVVRFAQRQRVASWAVVGGGLGIADAVAWYRVREDELRPPVDAARFLTAHLARAGLASAVGLLTARRLDSFVAERRRAAGLAAQCVATVGLGNALCVGDPPTCSAVAGTINIVCCLDAPLSDGALLEAVALVVEARTLAVIQSGVASTASEGLATGTGTDCVVVACPEASRERPAASYAGKHTVLGSLIGQTVTAAVTRGIADWLAEAAAQKEAAWPARATRR